MVTSRNGREKGMSTMTTTLNPVCYVCGYEIIDDSPPTSWNDQSVHKECYSDLLAPHYHLWLVANNGRNDGKNGATAIFRRAPRFATREQAMRAAVPQYGKKREDAMALKCECVKGVKAIVPKA